MAVTGWNRMEMADMVKNCRKIAVNGWMAKMAENYRVWLKMPENC